MPSQQELPARGAGDLLVLTFEDIAGDLVAGYFSASLRAPHTEEGSYCAKVVLEAYSDEIWSF